MARFGTGNLVMGAVRGKKLLLAGTGVPGGKMVYGVRTPAGASAAAGILGHQQKIGDQANRAPARADGRGDLVAIWKGSGRWRSGANGWSCPDRSPCGFGCAPRLRSRPAHSSIGSRSSDLEQALKGLGGRAARDLKGPGGEIDMAGHAYQSAGWCGEALIEPLTDVALML